MGKKKKRRQRAQAGAPMRGDIINVAGVLYEYAPPALNELWARKSRLADAADLARERLFRAQADNLAQRVIGQAQCELYAAQEAYEQAHLDVWMALQEEQGG